MAGGHEEKGHLRSGSHGGHPRHQRRQIVLPLRANRVQVGLQRICVPVQLVILKVQSLHIGVRVDSRHRDPRVAVLSEASLRVQSDHVVVAVEWVVGVSAAEEVAPAHQALIEPAFALNLFGLAATHRSLPAECEHLIDPSLLDQLSHFVNQHNTTW